MPQYSQNVSDQIMKSGNTGSGLPWRLLMFSFVVFFLSILAYFGLSFGYSGYLESKIADKDLEIADLTKKIAPGSENVFVDFYSRLSNYKNIFDSHIYNSKIFPTLEKITIPSVYYTSVDLNVENRTMILSGSASDFESLSNQLSLFDQDAKSKDPMIEVYILNQSRMVEGLVNFKVTLIFSPKLFAKSNP